MKYTFQDASTPIMEGIIDLHTYIMFGPAEIVAFVFIAIGLTLQRFYYRINHPVDRLVTAKVVHCTWLELVWTVAPLGILISIAVPSFALLYVSNPVSLTPLWGPVALFFDPSGPAGGGGGGSGGGGGGTGGGGPLWWILMAVAQTVVGLGVLTGVSAVGLVAAHQAGLIDLWEVFRAAQQVRELLGPDGAVPAVNAAFGLTRAAARTLAGAAANLGGEFEGGDWLAHWG